MAVLSELRYPTTRLAKFLSGIFAIALFLFVSIAAVSGFLLYQVLHPSRAPATIDLSVMMGHPVAFSFPVPNARIARAGFILACAARRRLWFATDTIRSARMC